MSVEKERTVDDLIDTISAIGASSNAPTYERARAELTRKYVSDLISTIEKLNLAISNNSEASNVLAQKVFWLNVILTAATCVGSFAAIVNIIR